MSDPHRLPTEIWRHIFGLATHCTCTGEECSDIGYIPFQSSKTCQSRYPTTAISLCRVSKQWQALAVEFLFQRVWIRHGVRGLLESLKGSMRSEGYGRYVRRLELPSRPINHDAMNPIRFVDILACCPYLQILVKPAFYGNIGSDFWSNHIPAEQPQINDVVLTSLKQVVVTTDRTLLWAVTPFFPASFSVHRTCAMSLYHGYLGQYSKMLIELVTQFFFLP